MFVDVSCETGLIILEALGKIWNLFSGDDILKMNPKYVFIHFN